MVLVQCILIVPFLLMFRVEEVWYVLNMPDPLSRVYLTEMDKMGTVINWLPSMHTSIAVASIILARRHKDKLFKYSWGLFNCGVVISTVWFPIHWVIDVIIGIGLGVVAVKIADKLVTGLKPWLCSIVAIKSNQSILSEVAK